MESDSIRGLGGNSTEILDESHKFVRPPTPICSIRCIDTF
jgi:hypothetical protein